MCIYIYIERERDVCSAEAALDETFSDVSKVRGCSARALASNTTTTTTTTTINTTATTTTTTTTTNDNDHVIIDIVIQMNIVMAIIDINNTNEHSNGIVMNII